MHFASNNESTCGWPPNGATYHEDEPVQHGLFQALGVGRLRALQCGVQLLKNNVLYYNNILYNSNVLLKKRVPFMVKILTCAFASMGFSLTTCIIEIPTVRTIISSILL
jgi:hypothetical protein